MRISKFVTSLVFATICSQAMAQDFIEVTKSTSINAPLDKVWESVGDFCAIQEWHPAITKCESYDDHGTLYRTLTLADGATISEKHAATEANSYTYFIKKSPLPVKTYKATFKAEANNSGTTVTWSAKFKSKDATDDEAKTTIEGIFDAGLASIQEQFK